MNDTSNSPLHNSLAVGRRAKRHGLGCSIMLVMLLIGLMVSATAFGIESLNRLALNQPITTITDEVSKAHREQAITHLNGYGWVDKNAGIVHIPITQAMALIAQNGLPGDDEADHLIAQADIQPTATPKPEPTATTIFTKIAPASIPSPVASEAEASPTLVSVDADKPATTPTPEVPSAISDSEESGETEEATIALTPAPSDAEEASTVEVSTSTVVPVALTNISFQAHVLPIFEQYCIECHGGNDPDEGLNLESYASVMAGSSFGSVIEPGNVDDSYLIEQVVRGRMPERGNPLTSEEIEVIIAWVEAGALDN